MKEEVINLRKEACKVSATSIGLSAECSLGDVKIFDHKVKQDENCVAQSLFDKETSE